MPGAIGGNKEDIILTKNKEMESSHSSSQVNKEIQIITTK